MSHGSILFKNSNYKPATNPIKWYLHSWLIENWSCRMTHTDESWIMKLLLQAWYEIKLSSSMKSHPWPIQAPALIFSDFCHWFEKWFRRAPTDRIYVRLIPEDLWALNRLAISLYLFYPFLLEANLKLSKTGFQSGVHGTGRVIKGRPTESWFWLS